MKWEEWRYDILLLIAVGSLLRSVVTGSSSWPYVTFVAILLFVREGRKLIPGKRDLAAEQYQVLHQRIDDVMTKVSRMELASGLRPKGRIDA